MQAIGFVGLPGSGKSEAAAVATGLDIPVVTMGDVIRDVCADRGLEQTEDNLGKVATSLREADGDAAIAKRSIPLIESLDSDIVVIDGIRGQAEVEYFQDHLGEDFLLVSIEAPFETRLERIRTRGRDASAEAPTDLEARDERERGYGMDIAMDHADLVITNTDSLEAFHSRIEHLLEDGPAAIEADPAVTRKTEVA